MIKLKINSSKNFLPMPASKGTVEQRLQKARLLNLRFYDNLQDSIINNEIAPKTFANVFKRTLGAKIGLNIFNSNNNKDYRTLPNFDEKGRSQGYSIFMPFSFYDKKIHKNNAINFLKETLKVFNYALNPKMLARMFAMFNKGYNVDAVNKFFNDNLSKTAVLKKESLKTFLNEKTLDEKINSLQLLRYQLLFEENLQKSNYQIDRSIEKHNYFKYQRPADYYDLEKYNYNTKLQILNDELAKLIQEQRSTN